MPFFKKRLSRLIAVILFAAVFAGVFMAGYYAGKSEKGSLLSRLLGAESEAEAKETDITVPLSRVQITPDIVKAEEDDTEEEAQEFVELTEENAIVSTASDIYSYDDMLEDMYALCGKYPDILTYENVGTSFDGRTLYGITFGNANAEHSVMAVASINGAEYLTTMLVMKLIEYYSYYYSCGQYEGVPFDELFDNTAVMVLIMANPDGVAISQGGASALNGEEFKERINECYERDKWYLELTDVDGKRQWVDHSDTPEFNVYLAENPTMITPGEYTSLWCANAYGVDISHNFDAGWSADGFKTDVSFEGFPGNGALTEVETALIYSYALYRDYDFIINYRGGADALLNTPDAGSFEAWTKTALSKDCIDVILSERQAPFTLYDFERCYEETKDEWAHLAYILR